MRAFCITILGLPFSREQARTCVQSGSRYGLDVRIFPATHQYEAKEAAKSMGLDRVGFDHLLSKKPRPISDTNLGCFISHFRLWTQCVAEREPIVVLEHDAEVIGAIPSFRCSEGVINLHDSIWNDRRWKFYNSVSRPLHNKKVQDVWGESGQTGVVEGRYVCLPGTRAYWLSPDAADKLITEALRDGPLPTDLFINHRRVTVYDYLPFPVDGKLKRSTIAPGSDWTGFDASINSLADLETAVADE